MPGFYSQDELSNLRNEMIEDAWDGDDIEADEDFYHAMWVEELAELEAAFGPYVPAPIGEDFLPF